MLKVQFLKKNKKFDFNSCEFLKYGKWLFPSLQKNLKFNFDSYKS